ncbi:hypothetical protein EIN_032100 [Entamoeba invadens IP1]|uniref:Auxin efflux carrier family protein n=1 Tax=Entamoeba invadens IP1 TaxID=370355 RepID=A0A0A1TYA8_ENTIV|nr:hypothetical protein EIN_032100 [Entamoeba invadens IP1]ELP86459.1 hypothetical protein EIN_032100 [Entamoeba invadens IP1]|eukprot:XP_004185805.1 hypothetical protein EIN_032100 [Entamoeba invadens IP1]
MAMDIGTLIKVAFFALIKLVFIALMGFVAARWVGFDTTVRAGWSRLIFTFFMPAIVFYQTATAISEISELKELWILPVFCIAHMILEFFGSLLLGTLLRIPKLDNRVFTFTLGFGNVMYIPMAVIEALTTETNELGDKAKDLAFSYICTYQLSFMVGFFVLGYNYINLNVRDTALQEQQKAQAETEMADKIKTSDEKSSKEIATTSSSSDKDSVEIVLEDQKNMTVVTHMENESNTSEEKDDHNEKSENTIEKQHNTTVIPPHDNLDEGLNDHNSSQNGLPTKDSTVHHFIQMCSQKIKRVFLIIATPFLFVWNKLPSIVRFSIKNFFSIPTMAAILGIIFMLVKWIRDPLLIRGDWSIIGRCIYYLGSSTVFCALFLLGGSLSNGPRGGNIPTWKILIGLAYRMVVFPVVAWVATYLMYRYRVLPDNKVMYFVLQLESFTPPALNSIIVVNVCYPKGTDSSSTILFWCYMLTIVTMAVNIIVTMKFIDV